MGRVSLANWVILNLQVADVWTAEHFSGTGRVRSSGGWGSFDVTKKVLVYLLSNTSGSGSASLQAPFCAICGVGCGVAKLRATFEDGLQT